MVDIDVRSPRLMQAAAAALILLGFVADLRVVVPLAALGLLATYVVAGPKYRMTWIVEFAALVLSTLLFLIGHAGLAWLVAMIVAGTAALGVAADVWILPDRYVRSPQ